VISYSELTKPQKKVFDKMRSGVELQYENGHFHFKDGEPVRTDTATSLKKRNFILECYRNEDLRVYCVNIDVTMPSLTSAGDTKKKGGLNVNMG